MLQTFLQQLVPAMEQGVTLAVPLGILLAILLRLPAAIYKAFFWRALAWGFWGSVFIMAVKMGTRNAVSREVFEGLTVVAAVGGELGLLAHFFRKGQEKVQVTEPRLKAFIFIVVIALVLYHGLEIWLLPLAIAITAAGNFFTLTVLVKSLGVLSGLIIAGLSGYLVYQAAAALYYRRLRFVFTVQVAAILLQQIIFVLQLLMARQILTGRRLMQVMAPLINHQSWFIFIIFAVTLLVPVTLFSQKKPPRPQGANPAQYRKILMQARHKLRWGTAVVVCLVGMVLFSSVGSFYAHKEEELVPAVPVNALEGKVSVPLAQVSDGHLHRYVYKASGGEMVRFIIIQKGGSSYGVGLDACEICGPTGYYEKDGQVICKLCEVMMNKATIGMRGGCNPVPVEYKVENGQINVAQDSLEKERKRFK